MDAFLLRLKLNPSLPEGFGHNLRMHSRSFLVNCKACAHLAIFTTSVSFSITVDEFCIFYLFLAAGLDEIITPQSACHCAELI